MGKKKTRVDIMATITWRSTHGGTTVAPEEHPSARKRGPFPPRTDRGRTGTRWGTTVATGRSKHGGRVGTREPLLRSQRRRVTQTAQAQPFSKNTSSQKVDHPRTSPAPTRRTPSIQPAAPRIPDLKQEGTPEEHRAAEAEQASSTGQGARPGNESPGPRRGRRDHPRGARPKAWQEAPASAAPRLGGRPPPPPADEAAIARPRAATSSQALAGRQQPLLGTSTHPRHTTTPPDAETDSIPAKGRRPALRRAPAASTTPPPPIHQ